MTESTPRIETALFVATGWLTMAASYLGPFPEPQTRALTAGLSDGPSLDHHLPLPRNRMTLLHS